LGALAATVGPDAEEYEEEEEDEDPIDFVTASRKVTIGEHILFAGLESIKRESTPMDNPWGGIVVVWGWTARLDIGGAISGRFTRFGLLFEFPFALQSFELLSFTFELLTLRL
jgi:hypothetical protein